MTYRDAMAAMTRVLTRVPPDVRVTRIKLTPEEYRTFSVAVQAFPCGGFVYGPFGHALRCRGVEVVCR